MKNRIIVAGSRYEDNQYEEVCALIENALKNNFSKDGKIDLSEIISGTARGADKCGELVAQKYKLVVKRMPADWDKYGKKAGFLRNREMAKAGNALIAIWDGKSKGTKHMIDLALEENLETHVYILEKVAEEKEENLEQKKEIWTLF